jgi:uncharacterized protein YdcH (DUF465 family)
MSLVDEAKKRLLDLPKLKINISRNELPSDYHCQNEENKKEFESILNITKDLFDLQTILHTEEPKNSKFLDPILQKCLNKLTEIQYFDQTKDSTFNETVDAHKMSYDDYFHLLVEKHENKLIQKMETNNVTSEKTEMVQIPKEKLQKQKRITKVLRKSLVEHYDDVSVLIKPKMKYETSISKLNDYLKLNLFSLDHLFVFNYFKHHFNKLILKNNVSKLLLQEFRMESIQKDFKNSVVIDHVVFSTFARLLFSNAENFESIKLYNVFYVIFILNSHLNSTFLNSKNPMEEKKHLKFISEKIKEWMDLKREESFITWFQNEKNDEVIVNYFKETFIFGLKNLLSYFFHSKLLWSICNSVGNLFGISNLETQKFNSEQIGEIQIKLFICMSKLNSVKSIEEIKKLVT